MFKAAAAVSQDQGFEEEVKGTRCSLDSQHMATMVYVQITLSPKYLKMVGNMRRLSKYLKP